MAIDRVTFTADLLAWYDANRAELPWRGSRDPYRVWLSEVMLQQTQIATVKPYYADFLAAYPTVQDLAAAPLDDVLKRWEGLGYYSRARNMHRAAQTVTYELGGVFPSDAKGLLALSGIGRYTAAAIASIAYGEAVAVLDGNVIRVLTRLTDNSDDVTQKATQDALWGLAEALLSSERPGDYNQALMELGQTACRPKNPACDACPVSRHCAARTKGTQAERPVKPKRQPTPHYHVAAGMVWDGDRVLIAQRPLDGLLGGLWEFPGGKQEPDETLQACLQRELREELGIDVTVGELFHVTKHAFTHFKITLHAFTCTLAADSPPPQALDVRDFAWVTSDELDSYSFGKADRDVIAALKARGGMLF
jgi:A/G-specific adenine glycosylase